MDFELGTNTREFNNYSVKAKKRAKDFEKQKT